MRIRHVQADHYVIPLPTVLSDSTHGTIRGFELVAVRLHDADGAVGVATPTRSGRRRGRARSRRARLAPLLTGREAERIEEIWQAMWWALHYGGRGGAQMLAISAIDIALWDLRARRQGYPLARAGRLRSARAVLRGRDRPGLARGRAPATDRRQPGAWVPRRQDERSAPLTAGGHRARAGHARAPRRGVPTDGGRQHALERRRGDPGRARVARAGSGVARRAHEPDDVPGHVRIVREGGLPIAAGREPSYPLRVPAPDRAAA